MNAKTAAILCSLTLLAGCASGAGGVMPSAGIAPPPAGLDANRHRIRTTFRIVVPPKVRRAHYVSPSTASIAIVVDPGTPQKTTVIRNVSPGENQFALALAVGPHTFNISTYDGALSGGNPTGNLLGADDGLTFTVLKGKDNVVGATLQGVPHTIVVTPPQSQDVTGDQAGGFTLVGKYAANGSTLLARTFSIATQDADGNFIVGAGAPAIAATSSNSIVLSNGVASGSNNFTFTPGTLVSFPGTTTISITATPGAGAGTALHASVSMSVSCALAPRVYGWSGSQMLVFDENGNAVTLTGGGDFSVLTSVVALTYDANDNLIYTTDLSRLRAFDLSGNQQYTDIPANNHVMSLAYGGGMIYGPGYDISPSGGITALNESLVEQSTSGNWLEQATGTLPQLPIAVIVDNGGDVDILDDDSSSPTLQRYTPQGAAVSHWTPVRGSGYAGLVQDPSTGYFYVSNSTGTIQVFDSSGAPVAVNGTFPGLQNAGAMAWDSTSRRLYVYDGTLSKMFAFDGQGNAVALSGSFSGLGATPVFAVTI